LAEPVLKWRVRLFAAAAECLGARETEVELPRGATAGQLLSLLAGQGGPLLLRCTVAEDRRAVGPDHVLRPGAEVAVLPPVSGGGGAFRVGPEPIAPEAILREVADPDLGGQVLFLGTVRAATDGAPTERLEYEAYGEMAAEVLASIAARARRHWPGCRLAIWHRTGTLRPGEVALAVAAAAAHRGDAFAAARFAVERVKAELPVWKKEWAPDGSGTWVDHP
jgi:molybdopterin synthase catalytic subunit/molybdopterin converting factor small subunit